MNHGEYKMPGGKLIVADLTLREGRIAGAQISGDFFLEPDAALAMIDRALVGLAADAGEDEVARRVRDALDPEVAMYGISPEAIAVAVRRALDAGDAA
ncbi:MAG: biotin--protein ligase [Xanthomonadales bacterium]|nr:biotin--protein ligase [Xanthomonadales bacterium]